MRKFFALLLGLSLLSPSLSFAQTVARPSLWHVRGANADVYLLGSVHILPPGVQWRSKPIRDAIARADVFVFEVPQDAEALARLQEMIAAKGTLPPGQNLRALLSSSARADFDAVLASSGLASSAVERSRPWLAGLQLLFAQIAKHNFAVENGVDSQLAAHAMKAGKPLRYLESVEQQFAVLAPDDRALEMEQFEAGLKDLKDIAGQVQPMVDAWAAGDQKTLDRLINGDLDRFPAARKALLDDRNRAWLPQITAMLKEKGTFLVTVGAGHLTGATGLPTLLRKAGYKVQGP